MCKMKINLLYFYGYKNTLNQWVANVSNGMTTNFTGETISIYFNRLTNKKIFGAIYKDAI